MYAKSCRNNRYKKVMDNWQLIVDKVKFLTPCPYQSAQTRASSHFLQVKHFYLEDRSSSSSETPVITSDIAPCCNPKDHNLHKTGNGVCHNVVYNISSGIHSTLFHRILWFVICTQNIYLWP
jgi:hypothetical protein